MSHGVMAWRGAVRAVSSTTASTSSFAGVTRRVGVGGAAKCGGGGARRMGIHARDPGDEERVTSTDNATVKHFAKLVKSKAHRDANGSVVVAGAGLLEEIYANGGVEDARVVFLGEDAETPRGMRARRVVRAPEHVLKKAAGLQSVDRVDVVAELATPPLDGIEALGAVATTATRVLALDGIQDPGNLGTLTRTALALGWDAVALLPGTCDPFNDKPDEKAGEYIDLVSETFSSLTLKNPENTSVPFLTQALRAARGGVFRLPLARLTWEELETLTSSRGLIRYCAEPTAPDAVGADVAVSGAAGVCLVLGSEGQGLSETALRTCRPVAIPMPGEMESLNVGIAGGILMYLMRKEHD